MSNIYLRAPEAAQCLGLSTSTLAKMRLRGDGPVFRKAGPRVVLYARADLESWLDSRKRRSTSDNGEVAVQAIEQRPACLDGH